jgi:hypothetical protein
VSGEVHKLIDQARRATGATGPGQRITPATHSAVAVDPSARAAAGAYDSQAPIPGVPRRRTAAVVATIATLVVVGGIGAAALLRGHAAPDEKAPQAGYGLVQSTVAAIPSPLPLQPPAPPPVVPAASAAPAAAAPAMPAPQAAKPKASSAPPSAPAAPVAATPPTSHKPSGKGPAPAAPAAAPDTAPTARPVGGAGVATEF